MGQLRKRGNVWWIRYYRAGRRYEESSGSTRQGDAERLLRIREGDIARGVPVSAKVGQLRFEEAAADVVTDYRANQKRSLRDLETRIRLHLVPFFGGRRMGNIATSDARAYVAQRQAAGAANATINRELAILKRAFRLAVQAGKLLYVPHIPMLRENNVRSGFFERDEFEEVRRHLPKALRGVVTFAYLTGWRVASEVLPLKWGQVDRRARTIRLEPGSTKNDQGRVLPYGALPELIEVVEQQWREHEDLAAAGVLCPFVFQRNGMLIRDFRGAWRTACEAAGVPGKIPHDFRRTAVRNLVRAGVPDTVAMKLTGHKTRSVFDRYSVVDENDLRAGLGRLARGTGEPEGEGGRVRRFQP